VTAVIVMLTYERFRSSLNSTTALREFQMTTLLVVEYDRLLRESMTLALTMKGYAVLPAATGQDALSLLAAGQPTPDLILSEIALPDLDGFALLGRVRSEVRYGGILFVFVTTIDAPEMIRKGKALGADNHVVKPFNFDHLITIIEDHLTAAKRDRGRG
jgi:two-component system OmpR family response regulator